MRKILLSIMTIALVSAVAIGATRAAFVDTEVNAGNTFAAGSLDLEFLSPATLPFSVSDLQPGDTGDGKVTLHSVAGNLDGELDVAFTNYVQAENGCLEPEVEAGDPCGAGDLGLVFELAIFLDVNQDGVYNQADGDIELEYSGNTNTTPGLQFANANDFNGDSWDDVLTMVSDQQVDLVIMYEFPHNAYAKPDAIFMTDSLGFDIETSLEQVGGSGGVAL